MKSETKIFLGILAAIVLLAGWKWVNSAPIKGIAQTNSGVTNNDVSGLLLSEVEKKVKAEAIYKLFQKDRVLALTGKPTSNGLLPTIEQTRADLKALGYEIRLINYGYDGIGDFPNMQSYVAKIGSPVCPTFITQDLMPSEDKKKTVAQVPPGCEGVTKVNKVY